MKDVEIGTLGEVKVYMKLDELFRIANKEAKDFADKVCMDKGRLRYELDLAIEALKFYADAHNYANMCDSKVSEMDCDCGKVAREALKEIENDKI